MSKNTIIWQKIRLFGEISLSLQLNSIIVRYMKLRIPLLFLMLSAVLMLSSCLSDDDDTNYDYYNNTGISAFSLGTMNRYLHTTSSTGADSVYKTTYAGSNYKFTIDQLSHSIYNTDSLPYGTDARHVLANITAVNSGYIMIKSLTSDTLQYYSSSDSIDFTSPRTIRIGSQSGLRYTDYTVTVNVRQEPEGTMAWRNITTNSELAGLSDTYAVSAGGNVFVFGTSNGATVGYRTAENDGATWTQMASLPANTRVIAKGDKLFAIANGGVLSSTDGQSWTQTQPSGSPARLIAASTKHLYATNARGTAILSSADDGATWTTEALDDDSLLLPTNQTGYACTPVTTNDSIDRIVIVGYCPYINDIHARTWTKLDDYSSHPIDSEWNFVNTAGYDGKPLDELSSLSVTTFGGYPMAVGVRSNGITPFYRSMDGGITWKDYELEQPTGLTVVENKLAVTTDSEGSLWIISAGQVWKN